MPFYVLNAVYNSAFKTISCFISAAQEKVRKIHLRNDFRIGTANFRTAVGVHGRPLGRQHRQNPPTQQRPQGRQSKRKTRPANMPSSVFTTVRVCIAFTAQKQRLYTKCICTKCSETTLNRTFSTAALLSISTGLCSAQLFNTGSRGAKQ